MVSIGIDQQGGWTEFVARQKAAEVTICTHLHEVVFSRFTLNKGRYEVY